MDAYSGHPHDIQTEAHYHPELNADYLIYVKYANVMYNQLANYQIPIRVHDVTKIGEIAEEAFSRFGLEMYVLGTQFVTVSLTCPLSLMMLYASYLSCIP